MFKICQSQFGEMTKLIEGKNDLCTIPFWENAGTDLRPFDEKMHRSRKWICR